jgi:hypothetical protein
MAYITVDWRSEETKGALQVPKQEFIDSSALVSSFVEDPNVRIDADSITRQRCPTAEINIFEIHTKPIVKTSKLSKNIRSQQHESPGDPIRIDKIATLELCRLITLTQNTTQEKGPR